MLPGLTKAGLCETTEGIPVRKKKSLNVQELCRPAIVVTASPGSEELHQLAHFAKGGTLCQLDVSRDTCVTMVTGARISVTK